MLQLFFFFTDTDLQSQIFLKHCLNHGSQSSPVTYPKTMTLASLCFTVDMRFLPLNALFCLCRTSALFFNLDNKRSIIVYTLSGKLFCPVYALFFFLTKSLLAHSLGLFQLIFFGIHCCQQHNVWQSILTCHNTGDLKGLDCSSPFLQSRLISQLLRSILSS